MFCVWPQLKHHPIQYKAQTSTERFVYLPCGRQSGKTEIAMRRLISYLSYKRPWTDPKYFYAGPTFGQAKRLSLIHI